MHLPHRIALKSLSPVYRLQYHQCHCRRFCRHCRHRVCHHCRRRRRHRHRVCNHESPVCLRNTPPLNPLLFSIATRTRSGRAVQNARVGPRMCGCAPICTPCLPQVTQLQTTIPLEAVVVARHHRLHTIILMLAIPVTRIGRRRARLRRGGSDARTRFGSGSLRGNISTNRSELFSSRSILTIYS